MEKYDEILAFIGGVTNTYLSVSKSRGNPSLGNYIIPPVEKLISAKKKSIISIPVFCESCGFKSEIIPEFNQSKFTEYEVNIKGHIISVDKCPHCNALMRSEEGIYTFKKNKLVLVKLGGIH